MQKLLFANALMLCTTSAFAATFQSPRQYPPFGSPKAAITRFDPAGSIATESTGIDSKGEIAGTFLLSGSVQRGFIRKVSGNFTTFEAPHSGSNDGDGTDVLAINPAGAVAGFFADKSGAHHGFVRINGTVSEFDPPDSVDTIATGINSKQLVAGWALVSGDVEIGFVRNAKGNITVFSVPGAYQSAATGTSPECINTAGVIGGNYDDSTLALHGFVRDAKGKVTKFDPPSSVFTNVTAINTGGTITGYYQLSSHLLRGFLRTADGTIKTFTVSGSGSKKGQGTIVRAINDAGDVTGYYVDGRNAYHGFLRTADGTITTFNAPGAGKGSAQGTEADAFDAAGTIAGILVDGGGGTHGFVRTP
ncbi:MAG: hypothetical protein WBQ17_06425 [Rhizomicrobium sp.]